MNSPLGNYTRLLHAALNKFWQQHFTKQQLHRHLPPILKPIQVRRTRRVGHCWKSKDEFISDVLLWTSTYGNDRIGRPARTYLHQLCEDTGCSLEGCREWWMIGTDGERSLNYCIRVILNVSECSSFITSKIESILSPSVRPCVSSLVSLLYAPYIWVPSLSILRRVQSIFQKRLLRYSLF